MPPKKYIVVGDNNFWYCTVDTKREAQEVLSVIKAGTGGYDVERPERVYLYEARELEIIDIKPKR